MLCARSLRRNYSSLWKLHCKFVGRGNFRISADETQAADTGLYGMIEFIQHRGVGLELDAEHQPFSFLGCLDALGREPGLCRHEADRIGENILRERIENGDRANDAAREAFRRVA